MKNKNEDTKYYFSAYFGERKSKEHVQFEKHNRKYKVTVTFDGKLKCEFCDFCDSLGSPCRHVISCNRQEVYISDFHIRNSKSYKCRSMDGTVNRNFADYSLPSFRGKHEMWETQLDHCNESVNVNANLDEEYVCFFS